MLLAERIEDVIANSKTKMGVALKHIETGTEVMINADSYYPLASVFKVPILVEACYQMSEGRFSPNDRWMLKTEDKNLPSGILTFLEDGLLPTVKDLLTLMIIISDNTATDIILKRVGKESVNCRMRQLGFENIHIQMTVRELFEELLPSADPTQDLYQLETETRERGINKESVVFKLTPENNVGTPRDLTQLFSKLFNKEILDDYWSDFSLKILLQQQLNERIPRFLPPGTRCAHKTGTLYGIRNDSGIIYINENSHVALSIFVLWDEDAVENDPKAAWNRIFQIDNAMGEIALAAFEAFS